MQHPEFWPLIDAEADGNLGAADAERLQAHLSECDDCTQRLAGARREVAAMQQMLTAPIPPESIIDNVMAGIGQRRRAPAPIRHGLLAGIAANVLTAALLVLLSLGAGVPFGEMILLAAVVALVWGAIKGFTFTQVLRYLPRNIALRAVVFGAGTWVVTVALLGLSSLAGASSELSVPFLIGGSAIHSFMYGFLLSWFCEWFNRGRPPTLPLRPASRGGLAALLVVALVLASSPPAHAGAPSQTTRAGAFTPTPAPDPAGPQDAATETPTEEGTATPSPNSPSTAAQTDTPTPAVPAPSSTPSPTVTASSTSTATPATPTASPTAGAPARPVKKQPVKKQAAKKHTSKRPAASLRAQVRSILPDVINPPGHQTTVQRIHDVIVLLNFL